MIVLIFSPDLQNTVFRTSLTNVGFLYVNLCHNFDQSYLMKPALQGVTHNSVCFPIISFKLIRQLTQSLIMRSYEINRFFTFIIISAHFFQSLYRSA